MKSLKKYSGGIILSLFEILVGVLLLIDAVSFTSGIIMALGAALAVYGLVCVIKYFRAEPLEASLGQLLLKGLVALIAGVFFLIRTEWLVSVFPVLTIIYGVAILFVGLGKIQKTVDMLRLKKNGWAVTAISALLSVAFGVIILAVPFETTEFLWKFTGIALIVEAVIDIAAVIASGMKKKAPAEEPKEDEKAKEE
ncbi:MAG: DUF308 domain-containing protein [Clostridia bacterium]|nr:DUF308 domain-containing protein [Clostridia bacterium]